MLSHGRGFNRTLCSLSMHTGASDTLSTPKPIASQFAHLQLMQCSHQNRGGLDDVSRAHICRVQGNEPLQTPPRPKASKGIRRPSPVGPGRGIQSLPDDERIEKALEHRTCSNTATTSSDHTTTSPDHIEARLTDRQRTRAAFLAAAPSMNHHSTIAPLAFSGSIRPPSVPSLNKGPMISIGNLVEVLYAARAQVDHRVVTCTQCCSYHGQHKPCGLLILSAPRLRRRPATRLRD